MNVFLSKLLVFALGLVFGSFFAAFSWRYPRNISITKGRSFCPRCKKQISWFDNIPLLSFLFLKGKCRNCKKKISIRYFIIELVTAIGYLVIFILQGFSLQGAYSIIVFSVLEIIFIIDFEHKMIPDDFVFFGIFVWLFYSIFQVLPIRGQADSIFPSLFAGFVCALFLLLIHLITRGRGMGLGDVKFAVLGGALVGFKLSLIWLFLAFLTGAVIGIILILMRRAGPKDQIAFGPFLVVAIPITLIWGEKILTGLHLSS